MIWRLVSLIIIFYCELLLATTYESLSKVERLAVDNGLGLYNLTVEPNPENKIIGEVYVLTQQPFTPEEGKFLQFFNVFHVVTRESAVKDEVLLHPGDLFSTSKVRESEALLRNLPLRSLVVIIPVQHNEKSKELAQKTVDLLIVSRDVWSLRLEAQFQLTGGTLNSLDMSIGEHNIAGYNKGGLLSFNMDQGLYEPGISYFDPRLFGTRHQLVLRQSFFVGRLSNLYEGLRTSIRFEMPFYAIERRWGYRILFDLIQKPRFDFVGNNIRLYDAPETGVDEKLERKFRWFTLTGDARVTRSFGTTYKNNFHFGYGINIYRPDLFEDFNQSSPTRESFIRDVLPEREIESFIRLGYDFFVHRYVTLYDYDTYKLAEEIRIGPYLQLSLDFAPQPILLSDLNFFRPTLLVGYTWLPMDSFLIDFQLGGSSKLSDRLRDNIALGRLTLVSPHIFNVMRFVLNSNLKFRFNSVPSRDAVLGGNNGLRGFASNEFMGHHIFQTNCEFRTRDLPIWITRVGAVVFYDNGAVFNDFDNFRLEHSVGLGLRILLLQANRSVFRIDYAFPLSRPITNYLAGFSLSFGQAF